MMQKQENFTRYEIARIIGARALQIAMDAPVLLKISEDELKAMKYNAIRIAEKEFQENILPITIHRPSPQKRRDKLSILKEDNVSDEDLQEREKEEEKEIAQSAEEMGLINEAEQEEVGEESFEESSSSGE